MSTRVQATGEMQQVVRPNDLLKDLPGNLYLVAHSDLLPIRTDAELYLVDVCLLSRMRMK